MPSVDIRAMSPADVETLVDWAAGEGWNPGKADARMFRAADPEGFIGAYVDGELAAGIAAIAYGATYGFIGLYITREDVRGKGYGKRVWSAGIERLQGRTIGLDAVDAQFENYRGKGFQGAYRTLRYAGQVHATAASASQIELESCDAIPFSQIASYDLGVFGAPRETFLRKWLSPPHVAIAALSRGRIVGYGAVRQCGDGRKIGPLFASQPVIALEILSALGKAAGGHISIDVPEYQPAFICRLRAQGLEQVFQTSRMYLGRQPAVDSRVFGVTTLELG